MLIMNQTNTLIADCIEIYIDSDKEEFGSWAYYQIAKTCT